MSALRPLRRGLSRAPPALPARTSHRDRVQATTHPVRQHACPRATHTPAACRKSGLHMARHMQAASCRLLRSHAAVDGTPRRLMVPHTPPRQPWAAPRRREEAVRTTCCATNVIAGLREMSLHNAGFAPTGGRRLGCWLTPPCPCPHTAPARLAHASPVPPPAWQVLHETPSFLRADDEGQNHLDVRRRVWAEGRPLPHTSRGAEPPEHHGAAPTEERSARSTRCTSSSVPAAAARRQQADLRPEGAG